MKSYPSLFFKKNFLQNEFETFQLRSSLLANRTDVIYDISTRTEDKNKRITAFESSLL